MSQQSESSTSLTLLGRLREKPNDPDVWRDFVLRYGPKIHAWCRRFGAQHTDAEDVTQEVLRKLYKAFQTFVYDPAKSFHAYLRTVTRNAWHRWKENPKQRERGTGDSAMLDQLQQVEARDDLVQRLEEAFAMDILEEGSRRVQLRVARHNWEAFRLRVFEDLSGKEVANKLGMKPATVFAIQKRIERMLKQEIEKLQAEGDDS